MSYPDEKWLCEWTVYGVQGTGGGKVGRGQFSLITNGAGGYAVKNVSMPAPWNDPKKVLQFHPFGVTAPPSPGPLLPQWQPQCDLAWLYAAYNVRKNSTLWTTHLRSVTYPGHEIVLIRCDRAVSDDTPLLVLTIIQLERQDGTGHGGHL